MSGPVSRLAIWVADRMERSAGHPFTAVDPGPRVVPPVNLPAAGNRPGAGEHANDCAYIDDPGHRCVDDTGQPSNRVCLATWYHARRLHPAGRDIA